MSRTNTLLISPDATGAALTAPQRRFGNLIRQRFAACCRTHARAISLVYLTAPIPREQHRLADVSDCVVLD
jgi:hypothetical protein